MYHIFSYYLEKSLINSIPIGILRLNSLPLMFVIVICIPSPALNQSTAYYLLKPVNIEELILAVDTAIKEIERNNYFDRNSIVVSNFREQQAERRHVILPTLEGFEVVKMNDIIRLQGNGNFTDIFLSDGTKKMACRFLKHYDEVLSHPFIRVHRSHIINLDFVKSYHKNSGGSVVLTDNSEVDISANYKEQFLSFFK